MKFEEWLKGKGYMDSYLTDYQDAYDEGFDEGVLLQQINIYNLKKKITDNQNKLDSILNKLCQLQYSSGERCYNEIKDLLK